MLDRRTLMGSAAAAVVTANATPATADPAPSLRLARILDDASAVISDGRRRANVRRGANFGAWTLVEIVRSAGFVVLEDFTHRDGVMLLVNADGVMHTFGKTAESTAVDFSKGFLGHTEAEVRASDRDILGGAILAEPGDPEYDHVASVFPPIRKVWGDTYNFLGTPETLDKVWFFYGGRSPNFDPAVYQPSIEQIRHDGKVLDGLLGGWLPVLRFVYPEANGDWTEMLAFAPLRIVNENHRVQPVWYRVSRIEGGRLVWSKHVDSYLPYPPRDADDARRFYTDLVAFKAGWEQRLEGAMQIDTPDPRVVNMTRACLVRAMMGRAEGYPRYGAVDKNYGGSEHDGFPDTFTVDTAAMIEWGLLDRAGAYIDNYFGEFVRDDGAILYRGPETGQFGRMLTMAAQYATHGGDTEILLRRRTRIDAITQVLLGLRERALQLPANDPSYGMVSGWSEADAVLESDPQRYMQPYFSNSAEAARGFCDLGGVWAQLGDARGDPELRAWGERLQRESETLRSDLQTAIARSMLTVNGERIIPTIAGVREPFHVVLQRDRSDPQWRSYRSYMEMMHSGLLTPEQINLIVDYRAHHHDIVLGMPMAYGLNTGEMAGFLSYGHGYGLIQVDRIRDALLMTYSDMAHQYTRGMWMAPETRRPLADDFASAYCAPSELVAPLMWRWLLVFEDPQTDTLWLGKGAPQAWLADGKSFGLTDAPTRWGRVNYTVRSELLRGRIEAEVRFAEGARPPLTKLRLRTGHPMRGVRVNGSAWTQFDSHAETIDLPATLPAHVEIVALY
ncbi:MAG: hypothetical protein ABUL42_01515 [Terricaulis silvestris]